MKYLVKVTMEYQGKKHNTYYGKEKIKLITEERVRRLGYTTEERAKRNYHYKHYSEEAEKGKSMLGVTVSVSVVPFPVN